MSTPRTFAVVTDSTADLGAARAREHGILVVPLLLTVDGTTYEDGALSQEELFERMSAQPDLPTTSQPSPGSLADAYAAALETADAVIALHISSGLSGTCEAARLAARSFGGRVHVFDSRNLSWGLGWQVMDAVAAQCEGLSVAETLARLERTRDEVKLVVSLDSLENLRKGGRIGAVASLLGSMLSVKVTMIVDADGSFAPLGRTRGDKAALEQVLVWLGEQMGDAHAGRFAVGHALSPDQAGRLAEGIRQRWEPTELVMFEAGAVIATHAGRVWGAAVWPVR